VNRILSLLAIAALVACRTAPTAPDSAARAPEGPPPEPAPGIDASLLDRSVRPCDDFYRFACGGWIARTRLPSDKARWARSFDEMRERNAWKLRAILEEQAAGRIDPQDRYGALTGDLYAACMDETGAEARGIEELHAAWARVDVVQDARSLGRVVAGLHAEGLPVIFRFSSTQDRKDSTRVIGAVVQAGLSLPDRDYYLDEEPRKAAARAAFREHVARMLRLAGEGEAEATEAAEAVLRIEASLAQSHWRRAEMREPERTYNRLDRAGVEQAAARFPWAEYLAELGQGELQALTVSTPRMLERVNELLATTRAEGWRAYLRWQVLSRLAAERALPRAFVEADFSFRATHFTGQKALEPRWKHCVGLVDRSLGEALGQAFVRRHFAGEARARAASLVAGVEAAMGQRLSGLAWMDEATRARASEKLARVGNKVGHTEAWRAYDGVFVRRDSLARSLGAVSAFEAQRRIAKIGKPVERGEWNMTPPTVNAYWSPALAEMVFPAGILQPPMYAAAAPAGVNYGAIGFVVGHELTHGFDDQGRKYDALGNLSDWWSPGVGQAFEERAACVARQYSGYTAVDEVKLDGRLTLGENLSDLGGLSLAYSAWQASRAGRAPEESAAGFTPEQQFFLSAAQIWCEVSSPENQRLRALTDPHSPGRWRVNGPLSNLPPFAEAFGCRAGEPMVRAERCAVW